MGAPMGAPGYGPPPGGYQQPYGMMQPQVEGSTPLGFLAGFFGGCIGWILVELIAKGPATKKGARIGFACGIVISILVNVIAAAA
jgi:hypothetical protein